jgi:hypothetical protein
VTGGEACRTARGETCEKYFGRFLAPRKAIGRVRRARDNQSSWSVWISPRLGVKLIVGIARDEVEDVRDVLDAAVATRKREGAREAERRPGAQRPERAHVDDEGDVHPRSGATSACATTTSAPRCSRPTGRTPG